MRVISISDLAFCLLVAFQYDNRASDLTKDGMLHAIEHSSAFILFLVSGLHAPTGLNCQFLTLRLFVPYQIRPPESRRARTALLPDGDPEGAGAGQAHGARPR